MRIWMLKPDVARYDSFLLPKEFDPEYIRAFDGRTQMSNWKPVRVQRSYHDENLELSDYPNFCFPICSEKAVYLLKPLIGSDVEFLPVEYCEGKYCVINILTVINAVDRSKSAYRTFRDGKRIMAFMKYAFFRRWLQMFLCLRLQKKEQDIHLCLMRSRELLKITA